MPASASVAKETRKGVVTFRAKPRNGPSAGGFQSRGKAWDYLRIIGEDVLASRPREDAADAAGPSLPASAPSAGSAEGAAPDAVGAAPMPMPVAMDQAAAQARPVDAAGAAPAEQPEDEAIVTPVAEGSWKKAWHSDWARK